MKKILTLATAVIFFTSAYAHDEKDCGNKKHCKKATAKKECCKKEGKSCSAKSEKVVKATTAPTKKA